MKKLLDLIGRNAKLQGFLTDNRDMLFKVAAAGMLVVAAFAVYGISGGSGETPDAEQTVSVEESKPQKTIICVDVGGEVRNPVVAELEEGSRVEDAIKAAGGVTENADLTDINRAAFVADGDKILIPSLAGTADAYDIDGMAEAAAGPVADGKININTADSLQLQELNGVGPATAEKIMDYREENGRFQAIEDIKNVSGIGEKTFEKFKDDIKI